MEMVVYKQVPATACRVTNGLIEITINCFTLYPGDWAGPTLDV